MLATAASPLRLASAAASFVVADLGRNTPLTSILTAIQDGATHSNQKATKRKSRQARCSCNVRYRVWPSAGRSAIRRISAPTHGCTARLTN